MQLDRIGKRLTSSQATKVLGSAKANAAEQLRPWRLKADKRRGRIDRRLPSSVGTRAVGLVEAKVWGAVRLKAAEQRGPQRPWGRPKLRAVVQLGCIVRLLYWYFGCVDIVR